MKLSDARSTDVVQNETNHHFYRFERPEEDGRIRIRPLELFPNGLLIEKPMDTIVEAKLGVRLISQWRSDLFVVPQPGWSKQRKFYEREKRELEIQLASLQEQAATIHPKQRGSHANKVRSAVLRLRVLERGLEERLLPPELQTKVVEVTALPDYRSRDVVLMPSGTVALFGELIQTEHETLAIVTTRAGRYTLSAEVLKPVTHRWMSTV